ncbi:MAG: GNAT family N-acetyltransferase [Candidatus Thermoplasmatota archaeon]|nr:GNAT family N-acetyltransferase [Euryarchaeota archaeon]MBU4032498.1 GNAT family N-acetyltransferase [Candidatus Thermoplasmatota archaeon]MBU4070988.1 GNAT family N-acetyltransferase [Candidatus Thermoplasmatota archaeon]MBU4144296.1 GNAT family N-acetyltransferase [Candidatus Thermoplasmatota archaeon]MBU4592613.1 GNAT family N-acetyltransferase [Candidatus Thermoplasmatota archaeon]
MTFGEKLPIINLTKEHEKLYFHCLEDWSQEMKESGNHKECWHGKMKDRVRVKLGTDEKGNVGGMIQYLPVEDSYVEAHDLYFVLCIWVHGYKEGRGNFQKKGMGKALLKAAEEDVKNLGAKGLAAWGVSLPFWMRAAWFKKQGYEPVDKNGGMVLLWKRFSDDAEPPKWIKQKKKPQGVPGKVTVTGFNAGWCPAGSITFERAKKAAAEFGDRVVFRHIDTSDRGTFLEWGIDNAVFIDDVEINTGPPLTYEKIRKKIEKNVKKLKR